MNTAFAPYDPLPAYADSVDLASLVRAVALMQRADRIEKLATRLDPPDRDLALGWLALSAQRKARARQHFRAALDRAPTLENAAIGLALVDPEADTAQLPARARAVLEAQRRKDPAFARVHDDELAQWQPGELLFPEAGELRARWRFEIGEPSDRAEALRIVDSVLEPSPIPRMLLLRAELAAKEGKDRPGLALAALARREARTRRAACHGARARARARARPAAVRSDRDRTRSDGEPPRRAGRPLIRVSPTVTFALLLVCFVLSGFAALVYQTAWTREFAFVFGTSELAIAVVLAAYMAGLALGLRSRRGSRRASAGPCSPTACSSSASRCRRSAMPARDPRRDARAMLALFGGLDASCPAPTRSRRRCSACWRRSRS